MGLATEYNNLVTRYKDAMWERDFMADLAIREKYAEACFAQGLKAIFGEPEEQAAAWEDMLRGAHVQSFFLTPERADQRLAPVIDKNEVAWEIWRRGKGDEVHMARLVDQALNDERAHRYDPYIVGLVQSIPDDAIDHMFDDRGGEPLDIYETADDPRIKELLHARIPAGTRLQSWCGRDDIAGALYDRYMERRMPRLVARIKECCARLDDAAVRRLYAKIADKPFQHKKRLIQKRFSAERFSSDEAGLMAGAILRRVEGPVLRLEQRKAKEQPYLRYYVEQQVERAFSIAARPGGSHDKHACVALRRARIALKHGSVEAARTRVLHTVTFKVIQERNFLPVFRALGIADDHANALLARLYDSNRLAVEPASERLPADIRVRTIPERLRSYAMCTPQHAVLRYCSEKAALAREPESLFKQALKKVDPDVARAFLAHDVKKPKLAAEKHQAALVAKISLPENASSLNLALLDRALAGTRSQPKTRDRAICRTM